jgi:hypothetical protein
VLVTVKAAWVLQLLRQASRSCDAAPYSPPSGEAQSETQRALFGSVKMGVAVGH